MPTYTLSRKSTGEQWDEFCSYDELNKILEQDEDIVRQLSTPLIVSGVGGVLSKTDDGWKDNLKRIKSKLLRFKSCPAFN